MNKNLKDLREALDSIDQKFVDLLTERESISQDVARLKAGGKHPLRDRVREEEILTNIVERGMRAGLDATFVRRLYTEILDHSVRLQESLLVEDNQGRHGSDAPPAVVAFRGSEASYTHMAATRHFGVKGNDVVYEGYAFVEEMLEALATGAVDYAVLPMENTAAGSFSETYELLEKRDFFLVGEEIQRTEHCLVTLEKIPLNRVRRIYSPPQAFEQCKNFLRTLRGCHLEVYSDTALAVKKIRDDEDLSQAAIASEQAALLYGAHVLRREISDQNEDYTRMVIVAREQVHVGPGVPCKTSVIFCTSNTEGALSKCIQVLASHQCNLTKLESRLRTDAPWGYAFYVDFEGDIHNLRTKQAMKELKNYTTFFKFLGSYPSRTSIESDSSDMK